MLLLQRENKIYDLNFFISDTALPQVYEVSSFITDLPVFLFVVMMNNSRIDCD
jgi:hypothetical protein